MNIFSSISILYGSIYVSSPIKSTTSREAFDQMAHALEQIEFGILLALIFNAATNFLYNLLLHSNNAH